MQYIRVTIFILLLCAVATGLILVRREINLRNERRLALETQTGKEKLKLTFIEGWTLADYGQYTEKMGFATAKDFTSAVMSVDRTQYPPLASLPNTTTLEGYLFPDTYEVFKDDEPSVLVEKMLDNTETKLNSLFTNYKDPNFLYQIPGFENNIFTSGGTKPGMSLRNVIILASIVEKESGPLASRSLSDVKLERQTIAGIFYNRLAIGQALQSDATINYITKANRAQPTAGDLAVESAYNTYQNPGLPPGPICNPSLMSLQAVLTPNKTDYYYFLHIQPNGQVIYSKTFEEHVANKAKYLK